MEIWSKLVFSVPKQTIVVSQSTVIKSIRTYDSGYFKNSYKNANHPKYDELEI
jgi:hypothetical protein